MPRNVSQNALRKGSSLLRIGDFTQSYRGECLVLNAMIAVLR